MRIPRMHRRGELHDEEHDEQDADAIYDDTTAVQHVADQRKEQQERENRRRRLRNPERVDEHGRRVAHHEEHDEQRREVRVDEHRDREREDGDCREAEGGRP